MPPYGPVSRRALIDGFRKLGFTGPLTGTGSHPEYMTRGTQKIKMPNPHRGDIGIGLLSRILGHAGISKDEWESV
jgi:hypothetical protein